MWSTWTADVDKTVIGHLFGIVLLAKCVNGRLVFLCGFVDVERIRFSMGCTFEEQYFW